MWKSPAGQKSPRSVISSSIRSLIEGFAFAAESQWSTPHDPPHATKKPRPGVGPASSSRPGDGGYRASRSDPSARLLLVRYAVARSGR
jgi:hypothetical protein